MTRERCRSEPTPEPHEPADAIADLRFGRHAIELLQAARESGDPSLIAQAELVAMIAGHVLARSLAAERGAAEA